MNLVVVSKLGRAALVATASLMIALLSSGPVLADTDIGTTGVVGMHSLVDTASKPGVTCRYYAGGLLKHIDVRAPRMRASRFVQDVGWRFMVLRTKNPGGPDATTKTTYTSSLQTARTTNTRNARFSSMTVKVNVPRNGRTFDAFYEYVVNVEMVWMQGSSQVTGTSTHRVDNYHCVVGARSSTQGPCGSVAIG